MKKPFISCFAKDLNQFLQNKQNVGFQYQTAEYILHQFDKFCAGQGITEPLVTKELVNLWLSSLKNCCSRTIAARASVIRQFSFFLLSIGRDAYIPLQRYHGRKRQVHVLSDDEITAFFKKIDQYQPKINADSFNRLAMEYRVMFRILLCCGMRVSEVRKLKKGDVDLKAGTLIVRGGKGNKDRIVYLPDDLRMLLIRYECLIKERYHSVSDWFFPAREMDNPLTVTIIDRRFNEAWNATVYANACPDKPTVHSLRYTFVVKRMNSWMEQGIQLQFMLPYLSKYLGHKSVEDTFYYYHQVDAAFKTIRKKDSHSKVIIPEVTQNEN